MSFGENLRFLRTESGMTQEQFAEKLEVTRQSVSKWESDNGFPELEKILQISRMLGCDLDTLLQGSVCEKKRTDTEGYDRHMNRRTRMISVGVTLCILGVAGAAMLDALISTRFDLAGLALFALVIPGVLILVLSGIWHGQYRQEHPHIEPFYTPEVLAAARRRFPIFIVCGIGLLLSALLVWVAADYLFGELSDGAGLALVAVGVGLLVYGALDHAKYQVEESYNQAVIEEEKAQSDPRDILAGRLCGIIMMAATIIFLLYLFLGNGNGRSDVGRVAAAVYATGGLLCGIVSVWLKRHEP